MLRNIGALASLALIAVAGYIVFTSLSGPRPEPLDAYRREAARLVAAEVAEKIRTDDTPRLVLMAPLAGDQGYDEVTTQLSRAIVDAGRYNLIDPAKLKAFLDEQKRTLADLHVDQQLVKDAIAALAADGIMLGKITSFPAPRGNARTSLDLTLAVYDKQATQVFEERYSARVEPSALSLTWWRAWLVEQGAWNRLLGWLAAVLLTPIVLLSAIRKILTKDSNLANLWLLLGLTAWSTLAGFIAVGLRVDDPIAGLGLLVAVVAGGFYNYVAASAVEYYMR